MGIELLQVVEESRTSGYISGAINAKFLDLIQNKSNSCSFLDFRPISLCNFVYNLISKIIAS